MSTSVAERAGSTSVWAAPGAAVVVDEDRRITKSAEPATSRSLAGSPSASGC